MPVVTLVSAKGSPGVTTAAAALAAAATVDGPAMLVELDPAGGDVRILTGAVDDSGVVGAAGELRRDVSPEAVDRHVAVAPPGLSSLLAPTAGLMATSVIGSVLDRWGPALHQHKGTVFVDAGRWDAGQPTARRVGIGDLVVIVCRPTVASVEHTRQTIDRLREVARRPVVGLVVGTKPYAPAEVAAQLDIPVVGAVAWDPRGTSALWAKGITKAWGRSWLAATAARTVEELARHVPVVEMPGARPRTPVADQPTPTPTVPPPGPAGPGRGVPGPESAPGPGPGPGLGPGPEGVRTGGPGWADAGASGAMGPPAADRGVPVGARADAGGSGAAGPVGPTATGERSAVGTAVPAPPVAARPEQPAQAERQPWPPSPPPAVPQGRPEQGRPWAGDEQHGEPPRHRAPSDGQDTAHRVRRAADAAMQRGGQVPPSPPDPPSADEVHGEAPRRRTRGDGRTRPGTHFPSGGDGAAPMPSGEHGTVPAPLFRPAAETPSGEHRAVPPPPLYRPAPPRPLTGEQPAVTPPPLPPPPVPAQTTLGPPDNTAADRAEPGAGTPGTEARGTEAPGAAEVRGAADGPPATPGAAETPGTEARGAEAPGTDTPGTAEARGAEAPGTEAPGAGDGPPATRGVAEAPGPEARAPGTPAPGQPETHGTPEPEGDPQPEPERDRQPEREPEPEREQAR